MGCCESRQADVRARDGANINGGFKFDDEERLSGGMTMLEAREVVNAWAARAEEYRQRIEATTLEADELDKNGDEQGVLQKARLIEHFKNELSLAEEKVHELNMALSKLGRQDLLKMTHRLEGQLADKFTRSYQDVHDRERTKRRLEENSQQADAVAEIKSASKSSDANILASFQAEKLKRDEKKAKMPPANDLVYMSSIDEVTINVQTTARKEVDCVAEVTLNQQKAPLTSTAEMCPGPLIGHKRSVDCLATNGSIIVTGSSDCTFRLWRLGSCQDMSQISYGVQKGKICAVAISTDGSTLVIASTDRFNLSVYDCTPKLIGELEGHGSISKCIAMVNHDGIVKCVSGSQDKFVRIWDARSRQLILPPLRHDGQVHCVATSTDHIISGSNDKLLRVWKLSTGALVHQLEGHTDFVSSVATVPVRGSTICVSGSVDKTVRVWDYLSGQQKHTFMLGDALTCKLAISPDGNTFVVGQGRQLRVFSLYKLVEEGTGHVLHRDDIKAVVFAPTGKHVITASADGSAKITVM